MRNAVRTLLIAYLALVAGCAYNWQETQRVDMAVVHKIESPLASEFCSKLLDSNLRACAVRLTDTSKNTTRCVMVLLPNDGEAAAHEGGHCMGYDHP
jgi:outer membrane lipopolysaccharide assembly protein LptE/RlpB